MSFGDFRHNRYVLLSNTKINDGFKVITNPDTKPIYNNLDSNRQSMRVAFNIAANKITAAQFFN